jgi:hypothetical protein
VIVGIALQHLPAVLLAVVTVIRAERQVVDVKVRDAGVRRGMSGRLTRAEVLVILCEAQALRQQVARDQK